jgi:general stress protein YciG
MPQLADLVFVTKHEHDERRITRLDGHQVLPAMERDRADGGIAAQRFAHDRERLGVAGRPERESSPGSFADVPSRGGGQP